MKSLTCIGVLLLLQIIGLSDALFDGCDHTYNLKADSEAYLESPFYPNKYPAGTSCRYILIAPIDFEILAECALDIDKNGSSCGTEFFYISRDGDPSLSGAEQTCGKGNITRTTVFDKLVIAYISGAPSGSTTGGKFRCKLTVRPQACDCGWSQNTRIVGGVDAGIAEFPSMVALIHEPSQTEFCGGCIISHRAVVTATHCLREYPNVNEIKILAGAHNLSSIIDSTYAVKYDVIQYVEHPDFNTTTNTNDITILFTRIDIEWSRGVGPACLPFDQLGNTFDYTNVNLIGWGTTSFAGPKSDILQKVAVNILPNSVCENVYPSLQSTQVCTYYPDRDACQFDSGGPAIYKGSVREFLLALISYGFACGSNPGVNTRITSFIPWIQSYPVGNLCSKPFT